ncbi:MAG TPA: protein-methionine-sulfoxide reductase heme-binding subunit MsrQ [candidate division Zixibacteria bacterium]|nr:protein-methionine-sulfoxide reductase heme-binding subunit MsrQ [candidate division Zixibacteria bacterium]
MKLLKPAVFLACLFPFTQLLYDGASDNLGVNPIEAITRFTGSWALIFLLLTLSVTPLRRISGWNDLVKLRRMLGLFAFFYACLHFATFVVLDHFFDFERIARDVVKRPYVTAGFIGFSLMIPLAVTSTAAMVRRLGRRWQQLHYLVYVSAAAGVIHFYWLVKADVRRPLRYGIVLAFLLGFRLVFRLLAARPARRRPAPAAELRPERTTSAP